MNSSSSPSVRALHRSRLLALAGVLALSACATNSPAYHRYVMQGQILSVDGKTLTVCIGERDGAKSGQVLDVVRHVATPSPPKAMGPTFRRDEIGAVRITDVFDEHYAHAEVLEGEPHVSDMVELDKR